MTTEMILQEPLISKCENILRLTSRQRQIFVSSFDVVVINCNGVLWYMADQVTDAGKAIVALKANGKTVKYLSTNSLYSDEEYIDKFQSIGVLGVTSEDILHPVKSMARFLSGNFPNAKIFSLCSSRVNDILLAGGVTLYAMDPPTDVKESELLEVIKTSEEMDCVLYDLNLNINYCQLAKAHQYLQQDKCVLVVGAADNLLPFRKKCSIIGTLGFMNMLHETTGKTPIMVGKPGAYQITEVLDQFHIADPSRVLYVGESLKSDVPFGKACGFNTLLVLTGTTEQDDLIQCLDLERPDFIANTIADFIKFFAMRM